MRAQRLHSELPGCLVIPFSGVGTKHNILRKTKVGMMLSALLLVTSCTVS